MIPEKFKQLKFLNYGTFPYVSIKDGAHMLWVGSPHRLAFPDAYDKEGFLRTDYVVEFLTETDETFHKKHEYLTYYINNPEYREYIKNFVVKNLL